MMAKVCIVAWVLPLRCFLCYYPTIFMFLQEEYTSFRISTRGKFCNRNTPNPNTSLTSLPVGTKTWCIHSLLKVGHHTECRCQYQPASFSSAFILSGSVLWGRGSGWGVPSSDWGLLMKEVPTSPHPSPPVASSFHTSTGSLDHFY